MTILIVDDEKMVRNWLEMLLRQAVEGEGNILTASNAEQALSICDQVKPIDLLITDIKMPQKSGIDLIIQLEKEHPEINTAVLSAYDDFQYVRTAMKHGAIDYILKSEMQLSDIQSLLQKVRLLKKPVEQNPDEEAMISNKNMLFEDYIEGIITIDNLIYIFHDISDERFFVLLFELRGHNIPSESSLINICRLTLEGENLKGFSFIYKNRCIILFRSELYILEEQERLLNKLSILLERNFYEMASCSVVNLKKKICETIRELDTYLHSEFQYVFINSISNYYGTTDLCPEDMRHVDGNEIKMLSEEIRFHLNNHRYEKPLEQIVRFVDKSHRSLVYPSEIKGVVIHCLTVLHSNLGITGNDSDIISNYQNSIRQIYASRTAKSLSAALNQLNSLYCSLLQAKRPDSSHPAISSALSFIESHYAEQISLDDLATHLSMNKSYLSHLFTKETGTTFTDYLENIRIYKAQSLLRETALSIAVISEKVGYTSQSYFSKAFKKRVGVSPNTYRASFR